MVHRAISVAACLASFLLAAPVRGAVTVQVLTGNIPANSSGSSLAPADCPAGSTALGGGLDSENPDTLSVGAIEQDDQEYLDPGSHPSIEAWYGYFANTDSVPHPIAFASLCMDGHRDVEVDAIAAEPQTVGAARVMCPRAALAVGGGVSFAMHALLTSSAPILDDGTPDGARLINYPNGTAPPPIGWRSTLRNDGDAALSEHASAVCETRLHDVATLVAGIDVPGNFTASDRLLCPAGQIAFGGGVDSTDTNSMVVTASAPVFDNGTANGQRLINRSDGLAPAPIGWFGAARNEDPLVAHTLKIGVICPEPGEDGLAGIALATLVAMRRRPRD